MHRSGRSSPASEDQPETGISILYEPPESEASVEWVESFLI